jgi:DNA adenine methylase
MHYVGSKKRMKNDLLQIFSKYRKKGQLYIEPFVGGCNSIDIMENPRWGNDSHYELIEMFRAIQKGWIPPDKITEEDYYSVKENRDKIHPALVGFVGFCCSFGGKYWGGFGRREGQKSTCQQNRTVLLKQAPLLRDIRLTNMNYLDMKIPRNSFLYLDPPYENTIQYKTRESFSSGEFWDWAEYMGKSGNNVFVSEYSEPKSRKFKKVFQKEVSSHLVHRNSQIKLEKLYMYIG